MCGECPPLAPNGHVSSHVSKVVTKLDLLEAHYRVRIGEGDERKTTFNCLLGYFQLKVLPFGLQGAPCQIHAINQ